MGGPRASTIRRMVRGDTCASCGRPMTQVPRHSPGERTCDACLPPREVYMHFFLRGSWTVQFLEPDLKTSVGRIRKFASDDKIRELIARTPTRLDLAAKEALEYAISTGRGGIDLLVTQEQYRKLRGT